MVTTARTFPRRPIPRRTPAAGSRARPRVRATAGGDPRSTFSVDASRLIGLFRFHLSYAFGALAVGYLIVQLLTAPEFRLTQFEVTGNTLAIAGDVAAAGRVAARNAFFVTRLDVESSVAELGMVQAVDVNVVLPNRVVIRVAEREPAYTWRSGSTDFLVSRDGIVLAEVAGAPRAITLVDLDQQRVTVGDRVDTQALDTAAYLMRALPRETGIQPRHFEYSRTFGIVLPTDGGFRVAFGRAEELSAKIDVLRSVLAALAARPSPVQFIDLRYKDQPYLR